MSAIEFNNNSTHTYFDGQPGLKITDQNTVEKRVDAIPVVDLESPRVSPINIIDVSWSNMFDTDLFQDSIDQLHNNESSKECLTTIGDKENVILVEPETVVETFKKPNIKRKKSDNLTKPKPKKEKKLTASNSKNIKISREENFKKVVKHWLNDVESNSLLNIAEPDTTEQILINDKEESDKVVHPKISISKEKTKKRVVQAQLANKEGKMKFRKPTNENANDDKEVTAIDDKRGKDFKEVIKEKKKSKFVAPIKSQTPVKDQTFEILSLDSNNLEIHANTLTDIANTDVFLVITYRNGFCQLNCNYTEDSCVSEGILIHANDVFFFFKTFDSIHLRTLLAKVLEANTIVCFDGKSALIFLSLLDINVKPLAICDTKIGGALLDPDNPPESFADLQKLVSHAAEYTIATDCALQKAAWYTTLLRETTSKLRDLLIEHSLTNIFDNVEMRLLPIIADMERRGVYVDMEQLKSMERVLEAKMKAAEQECHKAAGKQFQVNSPLQVRALLYDELKLDEKCNVKISATLAKGAKSTSEATLRSLMSVHPLPKWILEYRRLHKAHATFLTGIAQHVKDGVVKPTWVQTAAATGRIASNNPNLQAIPKAPFNLIMFPESEDVVPTHKSLRHPWFFLLPHGAAYEPNLGRAREFLLERGSFPRAPC
ncbi:DNA polymerase I-like [Ostrinia nubilalis]|uniref:DNA polymerase I-like n=1 Tax=Ostrinia nubilalis TaxID=29057 RepID=UPI0030823CBC